MVSVLDKIIDAKKPPVLFIGSGIPKRYLYKFPSWDELLMQSFKYINNDPFYYTKHKDEQKRIGKTDFQVYKSLGSIAEKEFNNAFFERKIKIGNSKNPSWVKKGISPYKMFLHYKFKQLKLNRNQSLKNELSELSLLKNKVSAVITTNYDTFIEQYILGEDYTVFKKQHEMFSTDSFNAHELYKIHGSITDAETIVITETDYNRFDNTRRLFIAKMLTLFAESPILFLGYSFTDENIRNIVSDFLDCLSPEDIKNISEHFVFISYKKGEKKLIELSRIISTEDGRDIPITEIQTDNFLEVYKKINSMDISLTPKKVRQIKKYVKKIIDTSIITGESENIIMGIDNIPNDIEDKNLAIAFGNKEDLLNALGYSVFPDYILFEDILFDNKKLKSKDVCLNRYKSISPARLLPVFKYLKGNELLINENQRLNKFVNCRNSYDLIVSKSALKALKNIPEYNDINNLRDEISSYSEGDRVFKVILKNFNNFSIDDVIAISKENYLKFDIEKDLMKSTHFKRVVMLIDLNLYYK